MIAYGTLPTRGRHKAELLNDDPLPPRHCKVAACNDVHTQLCRADSHTALTRACTHGHLKVVQLLLDQGYADVHS